MLKLHEKGLGECRHHQLPTTPFATQPALFFIFYIYRLARQDQYAWALFILLFSSSRASRADANREVNQSSLAQESLARDYAATLFPSPRPSRQKCVECNLGSTIRETWLGGTTVQETIDTSSRAGPRDFEEKVESERRASPRTGRCVIARTVESRQLNPIETGPKLPPPPHLLREILTRDDLCRSMRVGRSQLWRCS